MCSPFPQPTGRWRRLPPQRPLSSHHHRLSATIPSSSLSMAVQRSATCIQVSNHLFAASGSGCCDTRCTSSPSRLSCLRALLVFHSYSFSGRRAPPFSKCASGHKHAGVSGVAASRECKTFGREPRASATPGPAATRSPFHAGACAVTPRLSCHLALLSSLFSLCSSRSAAAGN